MKAWLLLLALWPLCLRGQPTNAIRQLDATTFQIGAVKLDAKERRITVPATVNMVEGQIEYVLVSALGKLHESIFKTSAEPIHIQTAALLLGMPTNAPSAVRVTVEPAPGQSLPVESFIDNVNDAKRLAAASWKYTGSRIAEGTFVAQRDGSIIAIIADPDALIETGRVSKDDDENWRPHKKALPAVGKELQLVISFEMEP